MTERYALRLEVVVWDETENGWEPLSPVSLHVPIEEIPGMGTLADAIRGALPLHGVVRAVTDRKEQSAESRGF